MCDPRKGTLPDLTGNSILCRKEEGGTTMQQEIEKLENRELLRFRTQFLVTQKGLGGRQRIRTSDTGLPCMTDQQSAAFNQTQPIFHKRDSIL